jgi:hypothetical protein
MTRHVATDTAVLGEVRALLGEQLPASAHPASFRDRAGYVFARGGTLYRQVNPVGAADYDLLLSSGLYERLTASGDLIPHAEVETSVSLDGAAHRVIRPERVAFISYPYEWCFGQLRDAALLTLRLQKAAMAHGMSLKDATPYNVAFRRGRPVWIDTLSFERLPSGRPWVAYGQFCQMFLGPLALMSQVDIRLLQLLRTSLDGIPLDLVSRLLPARTRLRPGLVMHLHLHAAAQHRVRDAAPPSTSGRSLSASALMGIVDSLTRTVGSLAWGGARTTWGDYYDATNYTDAAFGHKRQIVESVIARSSPATVWDLGANDGTFSRLASARGIPTVAFDIDPVAVERNYHRVVEDSDPCLLPLLMDLTNPSGASGWANEERDTLAARGPADLALALALVHHLAIAHNVPLPRVAEYMARLARALVIEFVPKADSQVQRMLASRSDIFDDYSQEHFEQAFAHWFEIEEAIPVPETVRTVYVMRRRSRP